MPVHHFRRHSVAIRVCFGLHHQQVFLPILLSQTTIGVVTLLYTLNGSNIVTEVLVKKPVDDAIQNILLLQPNVYGNDEQAFDVTMRKKIDDCMILALVITHNVFQDNRIVKAMEYALSCSKSVTLIHDATTPFLAENNLPPTLRQYRILESIAIPFITGHPEHIWNKLILRLKRLCQPQQEDVNTTIFFSHRQATGQKIALPLYLALCGKHKCFLDVQTEFDLHNLPLIVKNTKNFVLILSEGIFSSVYCLQEFTAAIQDGISIIVVRDNSYQIPLDLPPQWHSYRQLFVSPDVIVYSANILNDCVNKICSQLYLQ